jgi:hypothetical protein
VLTMGENDMTPGRSLAIATTTVVALHAT